MGLPHENVLDGGVPNAVVCSENCASETDTSALAKSAAVAKKSKALSLPRVKEYLIITPLSFLLNAQAFGFPRGEASSCGDAQRTYRGRNPAENSNILSIKKCGGLVVHCPAFG